MNIDETKNNLLSVLNITRRWYNPQLTYQNLKLDQENYVYPDDQKLLWDPYIELLNIRDSASCVETERKPFFLVQTHNNSEYTHTPVTSRETAFLYEGSNHPLHLEKVLKFFLKHAIKHFLQYYTCDVICTFEFNWYPFDTQKCFLNFSTPDKGVHLLIDEITYSGPEDLVQYYFEGN